MIREYFPATGADGLPRKLGAWLKSQPAPDAKFVRALPSRRLFCTAGSRTLRRPDGLERFFPAGTRSRFLQCLRLTDFNEETAQAALRAQGLTRREAEVLHWMAEGKRNSEIAIILGLSTRTVDKHCEHIFTKLSVETRTGAVRFYQEALSFEIRESSG